MAALSGERSCQNGRRAKRQGLLVGGLTRLGGASQDLPAARKPFRTGQQSSSLSTKLQGGKKARPIQLSRSRFCLWSADILSASVRSTLNTSGQRHVRAKRSGGQDVRDPGPGRYRACVKT